MIKGFAIDPDLVLYLARPEQRTVAALLIDDLRPEKGRLPVRYPSNWADLAAAHGASPELSDLTKARLSDLLARLKLQSAVRAKPLSKADDTWLENALRENRNAPFPQILAAVNPAQRPEVIGLDTLDPSEESPWSTTTSQQVSKEATAIAQALVPLFEYANEIRFIDPYFDPSTSRWRASVKACLQSARAVRGATTPPAVEFHVAVKKLKNPTGSYLRHVSSGNLPQIVPAGWRLRVVGWTERVRGRKLHNRFVLTERVGVQFGSGLAEDRGQMDDVTLLAESVRSTHWADYGRLNPAFDLAADIEVQGVMSPS